MVKYNHNIEDWWRHLGCYDREQASGISYVKGHTAIHLQLTDAWWESLSNEQKAEVYEDFLNE
jgi:hypothetical protein